MLDFTIRRFSHNTFDCFFGTQWDDHTRVRRGRHFTSHVSGARLPHATMKELHDILDVNMPINYNQTPYQTLANCVAIQESR